MDAILATGVDVLRGNNAFGDSAEKTFEDNEKDTFGSKIIRQNEILRNADGRVVGEIDFETDEAIVEVGSSLTGKLGQLDRLAKVAKDRGKRLDVICGPNTPYVQLTFMRDSLRKKWGNRVRFIPHP